MALGGGGGMLGMAEVVQMTPKEIVDIMAKTVIAMHIYKIYIEVVNIRNDIRHVYISL